VYAWEAVWWGLDDDAQEFTFEEMPPQRLYGMKNFAGLMYDRDGAGGAYSDRPVNDYYGYGLPIVDPPAPSAGYVRVVSQRVRTNFQAQNLELNIIRFPVCDYGCGGGCSSCDTGCHSDCNVCEQACAPVSAFSMYGSCGVRYFRIDDDFGYDSEHAYYDGAAWENDMPNGYSYDNVWDMFYDIEVDNNLIGPQVGWTTNYCYCKWNFFCNSTFGVFNNHIEVSQSMRDGMGTMPTFQDGRMMDVESDKDDIAFLGELRLGAAYDFTCHWRGVAAYRAIAISGIANSSDQFKSDYTNYEYVQIIDSDASMIVHGVQVGAECRY
jgi:hypothetical protein